MAHSFANEVSPFFSRTSYDVLYVGIAPFTLFSGSGGNNYMSWRQQQ